MKKQKIKMVATLACQFAMGTEVDGLIHEGTFYVPLLPGIASAGTETVAPTATDEKEEKPATKSRKSAADKEEKEEKAPAKGAKKPAVDVSAIVSETLKKLDDGDIEEESEAVDILAKHGGDKKKIASIVATFMKSPKVPVKEFEKQLVEELSGAESGDGGEEGEKPSRTKKKAEPKVVSADDLKEGDKVNVYWEDNEDYFTGVVKKIDRKGVLVCYDEDGSEEYIDSENNTEIQLL